MRSTCTLLLFAALAAGAPESGRIRYRAGAFDVALAEAKKDGRLALAVFAWDG